jgi:hypothetical protein
MIEDDSEIMTTTTIDHLPRRHVLWTEDTNSTRTFSLLPAIVGILGFGTLVISCMVNCYSNYNQMGRSLGRNSSRFGGRSPLHDNQQREEHDYDQATVLLYTMLGLFCLESLLVMTIAVLACHAILFPEMATSVNQLGLLLGVWLGSLIGSHFLRKHFYRSMDT